MTYTVQFWSAFNKKWIDYAAITFNSHPIKHPTLGAAVAQMNDLIVLHPNDKFCVSEKEI